MLPRMRHHRRFPGETDEDFRRSRELVTRLDFSALHVFRFSARPGTAAYSMPGKVHEDIGRSRARELIGLSGRLSSAYIESKKGAEAEAVLQQKPEPGFPWPGLTENYLKVLVHGLQGTKAKRGSLVKIRIGKTDTISDAAFIAVI
jgi:threonylcarbamoyladenosine tRNA methylthiotransferase MtaB